jgi:hypothetical protein
VFEGRFRVTQDVTLAGGKELSEALKAAEPKLDLTGSLEYQVCSDEVRAAGRKNRGGSERPARHPLF